MLPNIRLSGTANTPIDSIGDFLGVSSASVARSAATAAAVVANNVTRTNASNELANRYATVAASTGWGNSTILDNMTNASARSGLGSADGTSGEANKTLAYYVKESVSLQNALNQQQQQQLSRQAPSANNNNHTTSLPWAAAVKAAEQQPFSVASNQSTNAFDRNNTIGSWSSPDTSSSNRSGWNEGSLKSDGTPDDGTAIWGNPSTKKAGIDWAEKESLLNPPQAINSNSEKRIQKTEPTISSINGTEAWGAPPPASGISLSSKTVSNSQQQSKSNENSGNTYGTKTIKNETLGWGDSSSTSSSLKQGNIENSSPPTNSIWNNLTNNSKQQKSSTDWLSSSPNSSPQVAVTNSRIEELNKQLEATNLFDALSSSSPPTASSSMAKQLSFTGNNKNFENQASNILAAGGLGGSNSFNDLKQMSANYNKNDLNDSTRQSMGVLSSSPPSSNNPQSQLNPYSLGITPSRDLLKQMVHQIQLAVQAGHLNAQILNQPMSTPTLQLVYTLLQQIKLLQQFQEVQQRTVNKLNGRNSPSNLDHQINRVQQNISLLHKAITQQQAALTKNETLVDSNTKQQQAANNFSYANISKLSTNMKVPSSNVSNIISNTSIESFKRSNLIDTLTANSNSDSQRMSQTGTLDSDVTIDKNLSPLFQTTSNILNNNKAQSFTSGGPNASQQQQQQQQQHQQQAQKSGLLPAQTPTSSAAAWLAFNSSDLVSSSSTSSSSGWPPSRISSKASQQNQQQINSDLISELVNSRGGWRNPSMLSTDAKDNNAQASAGVQSASLAPGTILNLSRPNSASNNVRQMNETNDILNKDSYYDWGVSNADSRRRNFDSNESSPPAIGGLSLQSNPWLFAPTSSSLNIGSGIDNLIEKNTGNSFCGKLDNGNTGKIGGDALNFLRSNDIQRSSSALYEWGSIGSSSMQYNAEPTPIGSKQSNNPNTGTRMPTNAAIGSNTRPAPPPGLMSNFGSIIGGNSGNSSKPTNDMSSLDSNKLGKSGDEPQLPSLDPSMNLWSGTWFD